MSAEHSTRARRCDLEGKVAMVTGGSRGLGREMVLAFAAAGADVIIASRRLDDCVELARTVERTSGRRALPLGADVGRWDQCERLIADAYAEFDTVDLLVNNAGMSPLYPSIDQVSEQLFDKVVGVNLKGPFRLASVIGTRMYEQGGGAIINISSAAASAPRPESLPYAMAKAGLNTLTEGLAQALAPAVRVNTIQCGPFLTDISVHWSDDTTKQFASEVALGRCGEAHEIVGAALYFASAESSFCTGATLRVDGGFR